MREIEEFTSPLDEVDEESDYTFELPPAEAGRCLIVDDDESAAALNRSLLEAAGYSAHVYRRPSDALAEIREDEPIVLITDSLGNLSIFITLLNKMPQSDSAQGYKGYFRTGKQGNKDDTDNYNEKT